MNSKYDKNSEYQKWTYIRGESLQGPFSDEQLISQLNVDDLKSDDLILNTVEEKWYNIAELDFLKPSASQEHETIFEKQEDIIKPSNSDGPKFLIQEPVRDLNQIVSKINSLPKPVVNADFVKREHVQSILNADKSFLGRLKLLKSKLINVDRKILIFIAIVMTLLLGFKIYNDAIARENEAKRIILEEIKKSQAQALQLKKEQQFKDEKLRKENELKNEKRNKIKIFVSKQKNIVDEIKSQMAILDLRFSNNIKQQIKTPKFWEKYYIEWLTISQEISDEIDEKLNFKDEETDLLQGKVSHLYIAAKEYSAYLDKQLRVFFNKQKIEKTVLTKMEVQKNQLSSEISDVEQKIQSLESQLTQSSSL